MLKSKEDNQNIDELVNFYLNYSNIRNERLFREFLPKGYRDTTISSVSKEVFNEVILSKLYLGMIITLYDDFADNPKYKNPTLLKEMYLLLEGIETTSTNRTNNIYILAKYLLEGLFETVGKLPNGKTLKSLLEFDLRQVFLANRYSELLNDIPGVANINESKHHGPYNMGMVAAGTIDLMGSSRLSKYKIGKSREIFLSAQRYGRICNVLTTFEREMEEGDLTNEIYIYLNNGDSTRPSLKNYKKKLIVEMDTNIQHILSYFKEVDFNVSAYASGLKELFTLHRSLKGII